MLISGMQGMVSRTELFTDLYGPVILSIVEVVLIFCSVSLLRGSLPRIRLSLLLSLLPFAILIGFGVLLDRITHPNLRQSFGIDWYGRRLIPHLTWLFFLGVFTIAVIQQMREKSRLMWDQQPSLHRAKTAEITAEGIAISDLVSRTEWSWRAFVGWTETKTLFVIFPSEVHALFLSKQAFGSEEELAAMRALCALIPDARPSAFQIVTSTSPPPLPEVESSHGA